jgi:hypothetical protein
LLSALEDAKERTLMAPAAFSCVPVSLSLHSSFISDQLSSSFVTSSTRRPSPFAFSTSATRLQVTSFLAKQGIANPSLAREVLLEYVARKERIVSAWPGGVRASIEVIQGGLRDVGIEVNRVSTSLEDPEEAKADSFRRVSRPQLGASPVAHLVEQIQLETGYISLSQLIGFLRSFTLAPTTEASKREFQTRSLPGIEKALKNWANACLLGGGGRYEVGIEMEEIKKQVSR